VPHLSATCQKTNCRRYRKGSSLSYSLPVAGLFGKADVTLWRDCEAKSAESREMQEIFIASDESKTVVDFVYGECE